MKVQLITNRKIDDKKFPNITVSNMDSPRSLDEFDVDVIDLGSSDLWTSKDKNKENIDKLSDFKTLNSMVSHHNSAIIIYSLPQDLKFYYYFDIYSKKFLESTRLKDMLVCVKKYLQFVYPDVIPNFLYEKTTTKVGKKEYDADFYFVQSEGIITISEYSKKATTLIQNKHLYLTTLNISSSEDNLLNYLNCILPKPKREAIPEWMISIDCFNDSDLKKDIFEQKQIIDAAQEKISIYNEQLEKNMYLKSILYTNGNELVEVVFKILEKILSCDLSKFVDEKKADFIIKKDNYTLIGEIKGVTSNIKNEHISQVDVHYQGYMDKLSEEGTQENVHQILIMNPFRNKPLDERDPVSDDQIKLAKRNGCLIIETKTLLQLFEMFVAGKIDVDYCEDLFVKEIGLLTL